MVPASRKIEMRNMRVLIFYKTHLVLPLRAPNTRKALSSSRVSVGFVIPSEAVVKKIKDQMRKTKDVREKMKIFFDAPSLRELYDENPAIPVKAFSDSYRVFVGNTLRPAFACYVGCCEGKLDKMMEAYEGKKFNLSNFSVGCVHKGTWILPAWQLNTSE
jgi:hypothetical protein